MAVVADSGMVSEANLQVAKVADCTRRVAAVHTFAVWHGEFDHVPTDPVVQLLRRPCGDGQPVVDDDDLVGELVGLVQVLRGEKDGRARAHQIPDDPSHAEPARRIEAVVSSSRNSTAGLATKLAARSRRRGIPTAGLDVTVRFLGVRTLN